MPPSPKAALPGLRVPETQLGQLRADRSFSILAHTSGQGTEGNKSMNPTVPHLEGLMGDAAN